MPNNLDKYHRHPCATCGHRNMHGEVSGCIALKSTSPDVWCDCTQYVDPKAEGRRRGAEGAARALESQAVATDPDHWRERAQDAILDLIGQGVVFTSDDIVERVGVAPSPSAIGGLFKGRKDLQAVGFTESRRPVAHGRPIRQWRAAPQSR